MEGSKTAWCLTITEAELEPLFFTFVVCTFATSSCPRVHELMAKVLMTASYWHVINPH
jgi:hypothetical protein